MKDEEYTYRTIPSVKQADGSISVQTEISEGTSLWFSIRDKEKVTAGLDRMADQIKQELGGNQPTLVLHFDCSARGKAMFRNQEKLRNLNQFRQAMGWFSHLRGDRPGGRAQLLP
jgi:small ligand-binding sensory domain FIST